MKATTPDQLAKYLAIDRTLPKLLTEMRDNSLARDRSYARMLRIVGSIQLVAIVVALCFLIMDKRF
jgi:hypothetical protein